MTAQNGLFFEFTKFLKAICLEIADEFKEAHSSLPFVTLTALIVFQSLWLTYVR